MADDPWAAFSPEPAPAQPASTPDELKVPQGKPPASGADPYAAFNPTVDYSSASTVSGSLNERLANGANLADLAQENRAKLGNSFKAVWGAAKEGAAAGYDAEGLEAEWKRMQGDLEASGHAGSPIWEDVKGAMVLGQAGMHAINGAIMGVGAAVGQTVSGVILGQSETDQAKARRDFAQFFAIGGTFAGTDAALTMPHPLMPLKDGTMARVEAAPDGTLEAHVVGKPPTPEDFRTAASQISTNPVTEKKLFDLYNEKGIHPAEAVDMASKDAFIAHDLGAASSVPDHLPPPVDRAVQPAPAPGLISAAIRKNVQSAFDFSQSVQSGVNPMAVGSDFAKAAAKDFANLGRRNAWEAINDLNEIDKRFTPAEQERMWHALNEEQDMRLQNAKDDSGHYGLASLPEEHRTFVERVMEQNAADWAHATDAGLVDKEGIPAYAARIRIGGREGSGVGQQMDAIGMNLKTRTGRTKARSYDDFEDARAALKERFGEKADFATNIKANIIASKQLRDAIAGKELVNAIEEYGSKTGIETVAHGFQPSDDFITIPHPALKHWVPDFKDGEAVKNENGETVMRRVDTYVHKDFEGPLRSVLTQKPSKVAEAVNTLKSKATAAILISPMIHNSVIFSKAMAGLNANPFKTFQMYFEGNRLRNNPAVMSEAIGNGLVPVGKWFFKQDLTDELTMPDMTPGRSWTAKLLAAVPGLFDEKAGDAVKRSVDTAGDFWHNTLLWDRVADLQAGVYQHFMQEFSSSGIDRTTASRMAAHEANRLAGTLPRESMSQAARTFANVALFSRTFTLGNLGIMKDMVTGLPSEVLAQIGRDAGPEAAKDAASVARRQAISTVAMDMALYYVGTSVLQSSINVMLGSNISDEAAAYWTRLQKQLALVASNPWQAVPPWGIFSFLNGLTPQGGNEPDKQDRVLLGYDERGTGIYIKPSIGRIGEEFTSYSQGYWRDMMLRKLSTIAKPTWETLSNDRGFGRKVFDPDIHDAGSAIAAASAIAQHFAAAQVPTDLAKAGWHILKGEGSKVDALKLVGSFLPIPGATFTTSLGYPGGPENAVASKAVKEQQFRIQQAMPGIRQMIQQGDLESARKTMDSLHMDQKYQAGTIRSTLQPGLKTNSYTMKDFRNFGTPEEKQQYQTLRDQRQQRMGQ